MEIGLPEADPLLGEPKYENWVAGGRSTLAESEFLIAGQIIHISDNVVDHILPIAHFTYKRHASDFLGVFFLQNF